MNSRTRFLRIGAALAGAALTLTACSSGADSATVTVTLPATVAAAAPVAPVSPAGSSVTASPPNDPTAPSSQSTPSSKAATSAAATSHTASSTATRTTSSVSPSLAAGAPTITTIPAAGTSDISPITPVVVKVTGGKLQTLSMTNPDGRLVAGKYSTDETTWTSAEPLAFARAYAIDAAATSAAGVKSTSNTKFTTVKPRLTVFPSFFPNPAMKTVGIGQPMVVIFDKPPTDRVAAEEALTVTAVPAVKGSWYWWDNRTLHYRPENYWKAGTKISVVAKVYGVKLGDGMYGEVDRTLNVTVGPSKIAKVNDATKSMQVFIDGKLVRSIPVSLGRNQSLDVKGKKISLVTPSGTYVAQEKYPVKQMSSATYGLPTSYDLGYDKAIPLAVRISNGGIFVHSAPWSVADQGIRNVSHGCININPAAAQWFYNTFGFGDIVQITGTSTKLAPTDGFGDWNLSWDKWQQGSALR